MRGIRVVYMTPEQAHEPDKTSKAAELKKLADRCLVFVRRTNLGTGSKAGYGPTRTQVVQIVQGRDRLLYAAIDLLVQEELVRETKDGKLLRLWAGDLGSVKSGDPDA